MELVTSTLSVASIVSVLPLSNATLPVPVTVNALVVTSVNVALPPEPVVKSVPGAHSDPFHLRTSPVLGAVLLTSVSPPNVVEPPPLPV